MLEWLTILAIFVGPIFAVQVQKYLEKTNVDKDRKIEIFRTLMATRSNRVSERHVEALNMIEIEYDGYTKGK